jgi:alanine racemase
MLTWVEVSKSAIKHNLAKFKHNIGSHIMLMPVIKSNAYGHGMIEVAKICDDDRNVDRMCVSSLDEALTLIKNGIKKTIIILSFYELDEQKLTTAIKNKIIFPIYREDQILILNKIAKKIRVKALVHLKIDTGTTRIGILPKQAIFYTKKISQSSNLYLEGIWSHFASSESDPIFTKKQLKLFTQVTKEIEEEGTKTPVKHFACSAATTLHSDTYFNAVRLGLSTYGLYPDEKSKEKISLKSALSLNTKIIQIKIVPTNTAISYGKTYVTKQSAKIAVLPIGYWDGIDRKLSNKGEVLVNGTKCPIRGRVCMNLMMIDVTKVKKVKIGDKATIIGRQNNRIISVDDLARIIGTINYEVVDRINPLIPRIITK